MENRWVSGWMKGRVIYRPVVYVLINHNYSNDFGRKEVDWCITRKIKQVHKTLWNLTIVTAGVTRVMGPDHNLREWGLSHELFKFLYYQFSLHALKGFATFWEFSFYGQKKVADYEFHSLFAEKIHFHTVMRKKT